MKLDLRQYRQIRLGWSIVPGKVIQLCAFWMRKWELALNFVVGTKSFLMCRNMGNAIQNSVQAFLDRCNRFFFLGTIATE
jgi:hypothetical protein